MGKERNTKQKELIISVLNNNKDKHLTVEEILLDINKKSNVIGQATIYRVLGQLVKSGNVRKCIGADNKKACYQYIDNNHKCKMHYHLVCEQCGQTIHYTNSSVEKLKNTILEENGFELNLQKFIMYGICKECQEGDK